MPVPRPLTDYGKALTAVLNRYRIRKNALGFAISHPDQGGTVYGSGDITKLMTGVLRMTPELVADINRVAATHGATPDECVALRRAYLRDLFRRAGIGPDDATTEDVTEAFEEVVRGIDQRPDIEGLPTEPVVAAARAEVRRSRRHGTTPPGSGITERYSPRAGNARPLTRGLPHPGEAARLVA